MRAVLQASCAGTSCHSTAGSQSARFTWDVYTNGTSGAFDVSSQVLSQVAGDSMPPSGPALSSTQKDLIQLWIWTNALQ